MKKMKMEHLEFVEVDEMMEKMVSGVADTEVAFCSDGGKWISRWSKKIT